MKSQSMMACLVAAAALALSLAGLIACTTGSAGEAYDWPRWRGPAGNGISEESGWHPGALAGGPRLLWKAAIGMGHSNVVIKDGLLYTMGRRERETVVCCLQADTGETVWESAFPSKDAPQSTPAIDDSSVYAQDIDGALWCLNIRNGKLRWQKDLVAEYGTTRPYYGFAASPVVEGDLLILTADASGMAVNRKTGSLVWSSEKPPKKIEARWPRETTGIDYCTPVIYDWRGRRCALISSWKGLSSVDVVSGEVLWRYDWGLYRSYQAADPVLVDDAVYVPFDATAAEKSVLQYSVLLEIGEAGPTVRWRCPDLHTEITNPVVVDGFIYGCLEGPYVVDSDLRCVDLDSGQLRWAKSFSDSRAKKSVSLMAAGGKLIILTDTGILAIAEATPEAYTEISSCDLYLGEKTVRQFWTPPVLCNGRIYCRNYVGHLLCVDVRPK